MVGPGEAAKAKESHRKETSAMSEAAVRMSDVDELLAQRECWIIAPGWTCERKARR